MRQLRAFVAITAMTLFSVLAPTVSRAAVCGFPGFIHAGLAGGGTGYVVLFIAGVLTGIGAVPLAAGNGQACMDMWRDATLGPVPVNFLAVYSGGPPACGAAACVAGPSVCAPVTSCIAFP